MGPPIKEAPMERIATLEQFAAFGKVMASAESHQNQVFASIQAQRDAYERESPFFAKLNYHKHRPGLEDYNRLYDHLPTSVDVSPQVAAVLAVQQAQLEKQKDKYEFWRGFSACSGPISVIVGALFPALAVSDNIAQSIGFPKGTGTAVSVGGGFISYIKNEREHKKFMEEFLRTCDKTVHSIMSAYRLSEKANGDYVLTCGRYEGIHDSITDYDYIDVVGAGLAPGFNMAKIDALVKKATTASPPPPRNG